MLGEHKRYDRFTVFKALISNPYLWHLPRQIRRTIPCGVTHLSNDFQTQINVPSRVKGGAGLGKLREPAKDTVVLNYKKMIIDVSPLLFTTGRALLGERDAKGSEGSIGFCLES